jgi:cellulose synthase/poly-beta-1,6-N-acetylglucosamine synthase-like glycosyltransferase
MKNKSVSRISLVIPVYNEENHIGPCLEAIAAQTVQPFEVIVVDNNSTDQTAAIARRYPFVTVLHEPRQGVVYARDRGYDAATGDIIGRLDGDSVIAPDWTLQVQKVFRTPKVDAVSGRVTYRNVGLPGAFNAVDKGIRAYLAKHMGVLGEQFLYGVNMAMRRQVWQAVRSQVCHKRHLHEDVDLAAHLAARRSHVVFEPAMRASINPRQAAAGPRQFLVYTWSNQKVLVEHQMQSRKYIRRVALVVSCLYPVIHLLYIGYNPATKRFSLSYAFSNSLPVRVSPVSESI